MNGLVMAGQLLLGLSFLVVLHEFGHFAFAKLFKMRVNKFYLFFDFLFPFANVANFSLIKKKVGDTEYGIGWFPLGGYVDIAGMVDENKKAADLPAIPEPWEFRAKPAWQRMFVMVGGILVNIIVGVVIFVGIALSNGDNFIPAENAQEGIVAKELAQEIGLKTGDKVINVNGKPFTRFDELINSEVLLASDSYYTVQRDGKSIKIEIPNDMIEKLTKKEQRANFIDNIPRTKSFDIIKLDPTMGATSAGLQENDRIVAVENQKITYYDEFQAIMAKNKLKKIAITYERKGVEKTVKVQVNDEGKIGIMPSFNHLFKHRDYNFTEATSKGTKDAFQVIFDNIRGFGKIFRGEISASNALSGPIGIAKIYGSSWDWGRFWYITGMLSMALAFANFLPIPGLDGGYLIFLIFEMITGRKPSEKVMERAVSVGLILILGIMAFTMINDIIKI
jgi:regulator of sigma E protease